MKAPGTCATVRVRSESGPVFKIKSINSEVFSTGGRQDSVENKIVSPKSFPGRDAHAWLSAVGSESKSVVPAVGPAEQLELVGGLLKELSHGQAGERGPDERRGTLLELLKVAREDSLVVWEEHFKTMLLLLLETLGDKDVKRP